jgi:hypothetical protein
MYVSLTFLISKLFQICRSVCDGGQIVWANSNVPEGLVENSKVRLATAIGMPICSVGGNLCVMVLFATQPIPMTPNAIEFLCSMARSASGLDDASGFAKSPYSCAVSPTHAKTDQFRGVWDISERLNSTYSSAIDFHLLPIERLQAFFDFQEVTSLNDICGSSHLVRNHPNNTIGLDDFPPMKWNGAGSSDTDDLKWINANFQIPRVRTVSELPAAEPQSLGSYKTIELTADALLMSSPETDTENKLRINTDLPDETQALSNSCSSSEIDEDEEINDGSSLEFVFEDDGSRGSSSPVCLPSPQGFARAVQIDARTSFRTNQSRFHEFMDAILGLTLFDCAELWLLSEKTPELYIVTALHRDEAVQQWSGNTKGMRLSKGVDVPGIVFETGRPHWDKHYNTRHLRRASRKSKNNTHNTGINLSPRSDLASHLGLCTAFGVPLPGPSGAISGVLALYSRVKVEPDSLLLTLVHKSVQLMSVSAVVRPTLSRNNSGMTESHFLRDRSDRRPSVSIAENPYSFFCHVETTKSSPDSTAFPFLDYIPLDKAFAADEIAYPTELPMHHQPVESPKRPWEKSQNISMPGICLYRTVSANELNTAPHPIFHSHSMPDNMYLDTSYRGMEVPRSKRARSIDLGNCTDSTFKYSGLAGPANSPMNMRPNLLIPPVADVYDHQSLQWHPFLKTHEVSKSPTMVSYPYPHNDNYPYMIPEVLTVNQGARDSNPVLGDRQNVNQPLPFRPSYQYAMPAPASPVQSLPVLPSVLSQAQTKFEASRDAFNADLAFSNEFSFDQDLNFNNYCPPGESPCTAAYPPCRVDGCEADSSLRSPFCVVHAAGGRRCQQEGCNKCAQVHSLPSYHPDN